MPASRASASKIASAPLADRKAAPRKAAKSARTTASRADLPLSEQAHRALMQMILSGELAPNEVVTERQIALQLGISRTPLREAVRRLEGERLLERQRTGTLVVRALPVEEFMHILQVRRLLEGEAARLAAGHVPKADLARLRQRAQEGMALPEGEPLPDPSSEDLDLHTVIAHAAANPVIDELVKQLRTRTAMFRFGRMPTRRQTVLGEHLAIIDALENGDGDAARRAMEDHIEQVRITLLARLGGR
jgi:DNA-binding GntR family transcriptional regulator